MKELREKVDKYSREKLSEPLQPRPENEFNLVLVNVIMMLVLRNASRSGTISAMRSEYILEENIIHGKVNSNIVAIQFAPEEVLGARKGPGEREGLATILKILGRSHKNFHCQGIKYK